MHRIFLLPFAIAGVFILISSCKQSRTSEDEVVTNFIALPADLNVIDDSIFEPLDIWTRDAKIIGLSEGEHGMNEGMDFRNSYIKHLVRTNQVQVLAIESGLLESRVVNQYIHGKDLDLDSVLTNGICYTFGQFQQNRDLLTWLRNVNASRAAADRVQFYGFDMSGSASNPWIDDASFALRTYMDYLKAADDADYNAITAKVEFYFPYLNIPIPNEEERSFLDLKEEERAALDQLINQLESSLQSNKDEYISIKGKEGYDWAVRSILAVKQNVTFLKGYVLEQGDQSSRERFMLDNLKWIREKEGNKKILLFAHLAHLSKDISRPDEEGRETLPESMFGELLSKEFGDDYQVIGNVFSYLDYYDAVDSVAVNSFPIKLQERYEAPNFCLKFDPTDSLFIAPQVFGIPYRGHWTMSPAKGLDIIFYTEKQHFFKKEE